MEDGISTRSDLDRALDRIRSGRNLVIAGPVGVGKTTLLHELEKRIEKFIGWRSFFLDLCLPGVRARTRRSGLAKVLSSLVPAGERGRIALLVDGAGPWLGELEGTSLSGQVIAASDAPLEEQIPAGFEKIYLFPLMFKEWVALSRKGRPSLLSYLEHGGAFLSGRSDPGAIVERFEKILLRNVVLRNEIRDPSVLFDMAVDILSSPGAPVSATRIRKTHTRSLDQARSFLLLLQRAGLLRLVTRIEDRGRVAQASRLAFSADTSTPLALIQGTGGAAPGGGRAGEPPLGWLEGWLSNGILVELDRLRTDVFCWRYEGRWGLALPRGTRAGPGLMIDVCLRDEDERRATLQKAMRRYGIPRGLLLMAGRLDQELSSRPEPLASTPTQKDGVASMDLSSWMLNPWIGDFSTDIKDDISKPPRRRSHLL